MKHEYEDLLDDLMAVMNMGQAEESMIRKVAQLAFTEGEKSGINQASAISLEAIKSATS